MKILKGPIICKVYIHFEKDLKDSLKYFNPKNHFIPKELEKCLKDYPIPNQHLGYLIMMLLLTTTRNCFPLYNLP